MDNKKYIPITITKIGKTGTVLVRLLYVSVRRWQIMKSVSEYSKPKSKKIKSNNTTKSAYTKVTGVKQKRMCLKCGEKFPSKGPYNRICDKCSSMNERVATSTYAVRESVPSEPSALEKRFYGQN
jgi:Zn finger protein HypA/HybF involved in hydrogenase expression